MPVKHISLTKILVLAPFLFAHTLALLPNGFNTSRSDWLFNGILPASLGLSENCSKAYSSNINCEPTILMSPTLAIKGDTLTNMCVKTCSASLLKYQAAVKEACANEDIQGKNLSKTWLNLLITSTASLSLYYSECLRDIFTASLCELTDADFALAWDAASPGTASPAVVKAFCADSCLTQAVVLNVPTKENLDDIARMCPDGIGLDAFPFIENMKLAGILTGNEPIFALNTSDPREVSENVMAEVPSPVDANAPASDSSKLVVASWILVLSVGLAVALDWF